MIYNQIVDGFNRVSFLGILPIIPVGVIVIGFIVFHCMKKDTITPFERLNAFQQNYKIEKVYKKINWLSEFLLLLSILIFVFLLIGVLNIIFSNYIDKMISNIDVPSSYIIGLTTMVITMAVVIVVFDKTYYLAFSIREILQGYRFYESMIITIGSCIVSVVLTMTLLDKEIISYFDSIRFWILELAILCNIASATYLFYIMINLMFSRQKKEFKLLDKLHRMFYIYGIDKTNIKEKEKWTEDAIGINIEYLVNKYVESCQKIKTAKLERVEFSTTIGCHIRKWYSKAQIRYIYMLILYMAISVVVDLLILREESIGLICLNIGIVLLAILTSFMKISDMRLAIMCLTLDTWGYYVRMIDGRERFIRRSSWTLNKYARFFKSANNLNTFMYILIKMKKEDKDMIKNAFKIIYERLDFLNEKNMFIYFSLFTIGFRMYKENIKDDLLRSIYSSLDLDKKDKYKFFSMIESEIFYLNNNQYKNIFEFQESIIEYEEWLKMR